MLKDKINIISATISDYPTVQNLARFYVYDRSGFMGWGCEENGMFECIDFKHYFQDDNCKAYVVRVGKELAGFVLLDKKQIIPKKADWNMGEFFIIAKFQGKGISNEVAKEIFKIHPGKWTVAVMPENLKAARFWQKMVIAISNNNYQETFKKAANENEYDMTIFIFDTMDNNYLAINDVGVLNIPIVENRDPLIDLQTQDIIAFGPSPEIPNNTDYTKLRKTVYDMLVEAQNLLPSGLKFCLYEGYRSLELQKKLFDDRYQKLKDLNPELSHQELFAETTKMVSPVNNLDGSINIPPHSTGGAFDIYLIDSNNQIIEMGIKVADWMKDTDGSISKTNSRLISEVAHENRAIMSKALLQVGFVNYAQEYWHWSYGDRYFAYHKNEKQAIYGSVK